MRSATTVLAVLLPLALLACKDDEHLPGGVGGGGGGGGGGGAIDGGVRSDGGDGAAELTGDLCVLPDLRSPETCSSVDTTGVQIVAQPGGGMATAISNGTFAIDVSGSSRLEIADGDADFHAVRLELESWTRGGQIVAPLLRQLTWDQLLANLGAIEADGDGSVVVYVVDGDGDPRSGIELDAVTGAANPPLYGGVSAVDWNPGATTNATGSILVIGVPEGEVDLTATDGDRTAGVTVPVAAGALTFAVIEL